MLIGKGRRKGCCGIRAVSAKPYAFIGRVSRCKIRGQKWVEGDLRGKVSVIWEWFSGTGLLRSHDDTVWLGCSFSGVWPAPNSDYRSTIVFVHYPDSKLISSECFRGSAESVRRFACTRTERGDAPANSTLQRWGVSRIRVSSIRCAKSSIRCAKSSGGRADGEAVWLR